MCQDLYIRWEVLGKWNGFIVLWFFFPQVNFWEPQAHWKGAWSVGEQLPGHTHIFPSSLLLFLPTYIEIHLSGLFLQLGNQNTVEGKAIEAEHSSTLPEWHCDNMCYSLSSLGLVLHNHLSSTVPLCKVEHPDHIPSLLLA